MLILTSQSAHPFQLSEFRDHVGIGYTDDDPALQRSLDTAVVFWEQSTRWFTRTTGFTLDWYTPSATVHAGGGVLAMSAVDRLDPDGSTIESVTADWYLTRGLGEERVQLTDSGTFRNGHRYTGTFSVTVSSVDDTVRAAVYGMASHMFTNRDVVAANMSLTTIPYAVRAIVGLYQRGSL